MHRNQRGITLVGLLVISLLLIILASFSINFVIGENGVLNQVISSKINNKKSKIKEKVQAEILGCYNNDGTLDWDKLLNSLQKDLGVKEVKEGQGTSMYFFIEKYWVTVDENNNVVILDDEPEEKKPLDLQDKDIDLKITPSGFTDSDVKVEIIVNIDIKGYILQYATKSPESEASWKNYSGPITFKENGPIYARLTTKTGKIGGVATRNVTNIDRQAPTAPTISFASGTAGTNGWYRSDVELTITPGVDELSGIEKTTYEVTGSQTTPETEGTTVRITEEGTSYVTAYVYDRAGHKTKCEQNYEVKKDSIAPKIVLTQSDTVNKKYEHSIIAEVTDDTSQVYKKKYSNKQNDVNFFTNNGTDLTTASYTISSKDMKFTNNTPPSVISTVYAIDNAGNATVNTIDIQNMLVETEINGKSGLSANGGTIDSQTGDLVFTNGGTQYGPYWDITPGTYEITYKGTNLPTSQGSYEFRSIYNSTGGTVGFPLTFVTLTPTLVVYRTTVTQMTESMELMCNLSGNVRINSIDLKQIE